MQTGGSSVLPLTLRSGAKKRPTLTGLLEEEEGRDKRPTLSDLRRRGGDGTRPTYLSRDGKSATSSERERTDL